MKGSFDPPVENRSSKVKEWEMRPKKEAGLSRSFKNKLRSLRFSEEPTDFFKWSDFYKGKQLIYDRLEHDSLCNRELN